MDEKKHKVPMAGVLTKLNLKIVAPVATLLIVTLVVILNQELFDLKNGTPTPADNNITIQAGTPFSTDPIDYDAFTHHLTQRPVLIPLVSHYKSGEIIGVAAKGWSVSDDRRVWTFGIRDGLRFANGDPLDGHAVVRSFVRTAFVMKARGSQSGLFERMTGFGDITSVAGPFAGVTASQDGQTVRLEFDAPARDVLDKLSFGLYAIAHPSDWNDSDGKWKDQKSVVASGPYEISSWGEGQLVLKQRNDFPLAEVYGNERPFGQATFVFGAGIPQADFVDAATGLRDEPFSAKHAFRGEANNGILFVRLMGQSSPDSPVHSLGVRRALREAFYESLASGGLVVSRSFLPPALGGQLGTETADPLSGTLVATPTAETLVMPVGPVRICDYKAQTGVRKQLSVALVDALERLGVASQVVTVPPPDMARGFDASQTTVACDVAIILTGILLSDPWDDLRFMVRSAEGIRLPDPTGRLEQIVAQPTIDIQSYNAAIWEDALVWPVLHTTSGFWIRPQKVSLDAVNLSHPPSELALIQRL